MLKDRDPALRQAQGTSTAISPFDKLRHVKPSVSVIEWREEQRAKAGYVHFSPGALDDVLRRETAKIGYWLDSSAQTPDETVDDILANLDKAAV